MALRDITAVPPQGSTSWYAHYSAMDDGLRKIDDRGVPLDTFGKAGDSDDTRLDAAIAYASGQTYPPPILLGDREYTFNTPRNLYDGFGLIGVEGVSSADHTSTRGPIRTRVNITINGTWLNASGGLSKPGAENWDITIRNIAFVGTKNTQWMGGAAVIWCMNIRDCSWSEFKHVLGSKDSQLLLNLCLMDGFLGFFNGYGCAAHLAGSDNSLFMGTTKFDSPTANLTTGGAAGQYHLWLNYMSKTTYGGFQVIAEGGWGGVKVSGTPLNTVNVPSGPNVITGAKIQGRSPSAARTGSLILVEGGIANFRDCFIGYAAPSTGNGVVHQTGGQLMLNGITYDRANGVSEDISLLKTVGGESTIGLVTRAANGGTWTGRPRYEGNVIVVDATVQQPTAVVSDTKFTLAVVPDTQQEVTSGSDARFANRNHWLVANKDALDLKYYIQVGDFSNWGEKDTVQYERLDRDMKILEQAGIPWIAAAGNHDTAAVAPGGSADPNYPAGTHVRNTKYFNQYFPTTRFPNLGGSFSGSIGTYSQPFNETENSYHYFTAGGKDWMILNLEFCQQQVVLDWAKNIVATNSNRNVIINTHYYLEGSGSVSTSNAGYGELTCTYVHENLTKKYSNIKLVFCGHVGDSAYHESTGVAGNKIACILQCYHKNPPNYVVRLVEIDTAYGTVTSVVRDLSNDTVYSSDSTSTTGMVFV